MGARERMMRKVRDYDAELKALGDKARTLKAVASPLSPSAKLKGTSSTALSWV